MFVSLMGFLSSDLRGERLVIQILLCCILTLIGYVYILQKSTAVIYLFYLFIGSVKSVASLPRLFRS